MTNTLRRSGARTRSLAALVSGVALTATLAGCGSDDGGDTATDPAGSSSPTGSASPEPSQTPSESPTSPAPESGSGAATPIDVTGSSGATEALLLSGTDAGGQVSNLAFALDTDQARTDFVAGLAPDFAATVTSAAAEQQAGADGATTYGAVAAVGCDAPRSVAVEPGEAGFEVVARLPKSNIECFAATTYVVLFSVPDA